MNQRRSRKTKREQRSGSRPQPQQPRPKELPPANIFFVALIALAGCGGLLCILAAGLTLHHISQVAATRSLVQTLPDVREAAPGELAVLDGRIPASEEARYKEFVGYVRFRTRGWNSQLGGATPQFSVDTGSRAYRITNTDYALDRLIWNWTDHRRVDAEVTTWQREVIIQGLVPGSPVMAVGRLRSSEGGALDFHAESVVGLSRAAYLDRLDTDRTRHWRWAGILAILTPVLLSLCWRGVRRVGLG